jgi:hypothetical protein
MNVADANRVISELRAKSAAVIARRDAIKAELEQHGYAAHVDSDKAAQMRLARLNTEMAVSRLTKLH